MNGNKRYDSDAGHISSRAIADELMREVARGAIGPPYDHRIYIYWPERNGGMNVSEAAPGGSNYEFVRRVG